MVPIYLTETEDDNGAFQIEIDTDVSEENSVSILMDNENKENSKKDHQDNNHHSIYDNWTTMTPQEISLWIDK